MPETTTRIDAVAPDLYRISTAMPPDLVPGGFTFNQYLLVDEAPLLVHTGPRALFHGVRAAIESVLAIDRLRYVGFCHFEADECGALNDFLDAAPNAVALCSQVGAMTSIGDLARRPPRPLADGETLALGRHVIRWIDAPHVPHGWDNGFLFEETRGILFCGDLFTQGGSERPPLADDILENSEAMRSGMDYFAHGANTRPVLEQLAAVQPQVLACMHGSAFAGDGARLLRRLADALDA